MNSIYTIFPYELQGMWMFDDRERGLVNEAFVAGADNMIDEITRSIPDAKDGFALIFSVTPFPGSTHSLEWIREDNGGNWYYGPQFDFCCWLCPALFKYFDKAPDKIYVQAKSKKRS